MADKGKTRFGFWETFAGSARFKEVQSRIWGDSEFSGVAFQ